MGESRGGKEDRLLKESYARVYETGIWSFPGHSFQSALASSELKLKTKAANISGLQLADLLCHPVKHWVLKQFQVSQDEKIPPFAARLLDVVKPKLNSHLYDHRVAGYGYVLYPKK